MSDINTIVAIGRLTQDSTNINSQSGGAKFCIANNSYGNKVTFFNCSWFGDRGIKSMSWLRKGRQVCVTGRMECSKYNDKDYWGITVNDVQPVGTKADSEAPSNSKYDDNGYFGDEEGKRAAELAFQGADDETIRNRIAEEFNKASNDFVDDVKELFGASEDTADVPF